MSEEQSIKKEDEIDLIDLFVVILRFRKVLISCTLFAIIGVLIGYYIIPKRNYGQKEITEYSVAELTISPMASVAKYLLSEDEKILISLERSELFLNKNTIKIFKQLEFINQALNKSGNEELLFTDKSSLDNFSIIKDHFIDLDSKNPRVLSMEQTNWIYSVKTQSNTVTIKFSVRDLDNKKTKAFMDSLFEIANQTILDMSKVAALDEISRYQALFETESWSSISEDLIYDYSNALSVINKNIQPLIKIYEQFYEEKTEKTIISFKKSYIKKGVIFVIAIFFLSLFLVFILEFIHNIKNDEDRMKKIQNALGKN